MPSAIAHRGKHALDVSKWNVLMKEIAHGIDEHYAWLTPTPRNIHEIGVQRYLKAISVTVAAHCLQASRHALSVAVLASLANLGAPSDRIPGHLGPFNV